MEIPQSLCIMRDIWELTAERDVISLSSAGNVFLSHNHNVWIYFDMEVHNLQCDQISLQVHW